MRLKHSGARRTFAAVAMLAVGALAGASHAQVVVPTHQAGPPPREAVQPPPMPTRSGYVPFEQYEDGSFREESIGVRPIFGPPGGIGLPEGRRGQREEEMPKRRLRPNIGELFVPSGFNDGPAHEDTGEWSRAQPLMQNFEGPGPNGLTPPDPDLAAGYDYVVTVTNDDFAVYDRAGDLVFYRDIHDFLGVSENYLLFDPKVIFDPWNGRWVMLYHKRRTATQEASLAVIVSSNSIPWGAPGAGGWWWYDINSVQDAGTNDASWPDYFDLGYSNTTIAMAGNMFRFSGGFRWARMRFLNKTEVYNGQTVFPVSFSNLTNADGSTTETPRTAKMQWSWSESGQNVDAVLPNARWGGGNRVTIWKLKGAFNTNTLTRVDTIVSDYAVPPNAMQPSGQTLDTIDTRLMTAVVTGDTLGSNGIELFTGHSIAWENGATSRCRLYKFDAVGHGLEFESSFGSTGQFYWMPSVAGDYSGSAFWVFSRSSGSINAEIRYVDYNKGTFSSASSLMKSGTGSYGGFRWGDYFGGQMDWGDYSANISIPGRPSKAWLYAEYAKPGDWGTHVGATSVYSQGNLSSVTPSTTYVITGPVGGPFSPSSRVYTLTNNGQVGLVYEVVSLPSWLNTSSEKAQLFPGSANVTLQVNSNANSLGKGTYNSNVIFRDTFNNGNSYSRAVQLIVQAPDLRVASFDAPSGTFYPGQTINVTGSYVNDGDYATGSYSATFYASTNTIISPADTPIGSRNYSSLAPGGTQNFSHILTLPCLSPQPYYIGVIVTVTNDSNNGNNTGVDLTPIDYRLCPADFNQDCTVNSLDFIAFLNAYTSGNKSADWNGDTVVNSLDFIAFLNDYNSACP